MFRKKMLLITLLLMFVTFLSAINLNIFKNNDQDEENNPLLDSLYQVIDDQNEKLENMQTIIDSLQTIVDSLNYDDGSAKEQYVINYFELPASYEFAGIKFDLKNERIRSKLQLIFDYEVKKAYKYIPRSTIYFPIFDSCFAKYNIPDDARYLAVAESYLSYMAYSSVGAAGIWQFMSSTGKLYNLSINEYLDERRNIFKATEAACKYLNNSNEYLLQREIDDWLLVMASYNAGLGNINKAISDQGAKDFFSLIMRHDETNDYIWRAIAIKLIFENEEKIFGKKLNREPFLLDSAKTVKVKSNGYHSLADWAIAQGTNVSAVWELNPWIKINKKNQGRYSKINQITLPPGTFEILVPKNSTPDTLLLAQVEKRFMERSKQVVKSNIIVHRVKRGETLSLIAKKYGVTVTDLKSWNHLRRSTLRRGMTLKINKETLQDSTYSTNNSTMIAQDTTSTKVVTQNNTSNNTLITPKSKITKADVKKVTKVKDTKKKSKKYTVRRGDSISTISNKIGVSEERLISKNHLKTKKRNGKTIVMLQKGQVLKY